MNFRERQEAVAIAAIFDEGGLQRGLDPRHAGQIDVALELLLILGFEVEFFDTIAATHDHAGFFRVGGVDQHLVVGHEV